jgi:hypothetical protein
MVVVETFLFPLKLLMGLEGFSLRVVKSRAMN